MIRPPRDLVRFARPCRRLARILAVPVLLAATSPALQAEEPVRFADSMSLSPDGSVLVLSWRGDLWSAPVTGGEVERLTSHEATESDPHISPDGSEIAFVSDRTGSRQVYRMPADGGDVERITTHTEGFAIEAWMPGAKELLVRGSRDHFWRRAERLFVQPLEGTTRPEMLFDGYGRDASISPDGRQVLFTREGTRWWRKGYEGAQAAQIWWLDRETGEFRKLTEHRRGERHPRWVDATSYLYTSQANGAFNVFRHDVGSGARTQLTFFEDDGVHALEVSADGSTAAFQRLGEIHVLRLDSNELPNAPELTYAGDRWSDPNLRSTFDRATEVAFTDDGREIAFIAGGDLWVMDTELREPVQITRTPEEERNPVFSPDFESIVFASDAGGQCDLWKATRGDDELWWWQQEEFDLDRLTRDPQPESEPRFTTDGKITYLRLRGSLWIMDDDGKNARELVPSWNEIQYDVSPDGRWLAYAISDNDFNRDVWIAPLDGSREPFNLSRHPDNDGNPTWSPDGEKLAFTGRRWEDETDLYYVWLRKADDQETERDRKLEKALDKMKGRNKAKGKGDGKGDGAAKKPANGGAEPKAAEPKAGSAATPAAQRDPVSGDWDGTITGPAPLPPDGLGFTMALVLGDDGRVTGQITLDGMEGASIEEGRFVAESGALTCNVTTMEGAAKIEATVRNDVLQGNWSLAIGLRGEIRATRRPLPAGAAAALAAGGAPKSEPEKDDKKEKKEEEKKDGVEVRIDFDGLVDRIERISIPNTTESQLLWSPDSKKLAFQARIDGKSGLYTIEFPSPGQPKLLTASTGSNGRWLKEGNQIVWLQNGRPASTSASGKASSYTFQVNHETDRRAKHAAAFDLAWRVMRDRYYDERLGNNNWDAVRRKYRPLAESCATTSELSTVVNLMLGELNGSHLGFFARGRGPGGGGPAWRDVTAHLGARFDDSHLGPGIKVRDVIEGTPAAREASRLHPGDVILMIDGVTVDPSLDLASVLTGPLDRDLALHVRSPEGEERDVTIRPTTFGFVRSRLYDHWIESNRRMVEEASDGRFGYLHIRGMNWPSFQAFENELYEVGHGKDGLVIDVRENGGGFTTDHLLTCLTQPRHAITVPRGGGSGYPHDRIVYATWDKPIVVLCNQNSFSNAEIFSHAIKTLGRGQVVGVQTAGGVISTGGTGIMDIGFIRLPFRGWYLLNDGEDMELNGCEPHHVVWPMPAELPAGIDRQLDKAIEVLQADVEAWMARPRPELRKASERRAD